MAQLRGNGPNRTWYLLVRFWGGRCRQFSDGWLNSDDGAGSLLFVAASAWE